MVASLNNTCAIHKEWSYLPSGALVPIKGEKLAHFCGVGVECMDISMDVEIAYDVSSYRCLII